MSNISIFILNIVGFGNVKFAFILATEAKYLASDKTIR